jgi:outer membrane protein TolC
MRNTNLVWTLLLAVSLGRAADILTLEQALRIALDNNRSVKSAGLNVTKAGYEAAAQRTRLLPQFSVSVIGSQLLTPVTLRFEPGFFGSYPNIGPIPATNTSITTPRRPLAITSASIVQPLTQLARIRLGVQLAELSGRLAREEVNLSRHEVAYRVKQLYYSIQQSQSALRALEETIKLYREVESLTQRFLTEQTALRGDLLRAQTQLARAQQTQIELEEQVVSAKEQLNSLLGRQVLTEFDVPPPEEASDLEADSEDARRRALEQRPEIRQARLKLEQAEHDLRLKRAEAMPEVSAMVSTNNVIGLDSSFPRHFNVVGVNLSWEPFNWGRRRQETAQKETAIEQARLAVAESESQVAVDVNDKFRKLRRSRGQLRVARLGQESALENLRVERERFAQQASLTRDVLQSEAALEQANTDYTQALAAFWAAKADYERALGDDQ